MNIISGQYFLRTFKSIWLCVVLFIVTTVLWANISLIPNTVLISAYIVIGALLAILLIAPSLFDSIYEKIKTVLNFIGRSLLQTILIAIYFFVVTPIGFLFYRFSKQGRIINVGNAIFQKKSNSSFIDRGGDHTLGIKRSQKTAKLYSSIDIIKTIINSGEFVLLPSILLIVVLMLIFSLVSSPVVAPFIYTVF